ncbi:MAG TPA: hypothetical protein VJ823_03830 [Rhodanobacteraceae bacterium]|nr:hypothetical protein [Rhodanobacteraceae bacterium]
MRIAQTGKTQGLQTGPALLAQPGFIDENAEFHSIRIVWRTCIDEAKFEMVVDHFGRLMADADQPGCRKPDRLP